MEELFENQWSDGSGGWRDRFNGRGEPAPAWSNKAATLGLHPEGIEPPTGAEWAAPWRIEHVEQDGQGWKYGPSLLECTNRASSSAEVRRRRWVRPFRPLSKPLAAVIPHLIERRYSPEPTTSATSNNTLAGSPVLNAASSSSTGRSTPGNPFAAAPPLAENHSNGVPLSLASDTSRSTASGEAAPAIAISNSSRRDHQFGSDSSASSAPSSGAAATPPPSAEAFNPFAEHAPTISNSAPSSPSTRDAQRALPVSSSPVASASFVATTSRERALPAHSPTPITAASLASSASAPAAATRAAPPVRGLADAPSSNETTVWSALRAGLPHRSPADTATLDELSADVILSGAMISKMRHAVHGIHRATLLDATVASAAVMDDGVTLSDQGDGHVFHADTMLRVLTPMIREARASLVSLQRCIAFNAAASSAAHSSSSSSGSGDSIRGRGRGRRPAPVSGRSAFDDAASDEHSAAATPEGDTAGIPRSDAAPAAGQMARWARLKAECAALLRAFDAEAASLASHLQRHQDRHKHQQQQQHHGQHQQSQSQQHHLDTRDTSGRGDDMGLAELQMQVEFNASLIEERNREIDLIASETNEVATLFRDLSTLVHEQGEGIATIARNAEAARDATAEGVEHLRAANKSHADSTCVVV